jgi:trimeric autotransporter adhesin
MNIGTRPLKRMLLSLCICVFSWLFVSPLSAADMKGQVKFGGLPVPGAMVAASQGDHSVATATDQQGSYLIPNLADGIWSVKVEMLGFMPINQDVMVSVTSLPFDWDLKMLPFDDIKAMAAPAPAPSISYAAPAADKPTNTAVPATAPGKKKAAAPPAATGQNSFQRTDVRASNAPPPAAEPAPAANSPFGGQDANELNQRASDGFLVNGTQNNGAASPFSQAASFGNNRRGPGSLYQFMVGGIIDNSATNARNYSITGQETPKPAYNHLTGLASFAGPLRIGHFFKAPPTVFVNYQWSRFRNDNTTTALMPTAAERTGDFSAFATPIFDPDTGAPFAGNMIPTSRISPQAQSLLQFYPLPNFTSGTSYNYQVPIVSVNETNALQSRFNKSLSTKDQVFGTFGFQRVSNITPNVFDFTDTGNTQGINVQLNWQHRFTARTFGTVQVQYSRFSSRTEPYFANRENVSGNAGITGNNQEPVNWGPPTLNFSSGIYSLSDGIAAFNRNQTMAVSYNTLWIHGRHQVNYGGDFRRQQFNYLSQQNPRGAFTFTGASTSEMVNGVAVPGTGSSFAGFLIGIPDTSSLAFGNADKYFRAIMPDAFVNDVWRVGPSLTLTLGLRWNYGSPITELYGRLVNLDIASGFGAISPVVAQNPVGLQTGLRYPDSLVHPDKHGFEPDLGLAWRPFPASSVVIRGGYNLRYNTSVYQQIASQMAQQSPLSTSVSVQNSPSNPLTLAEGFNAPPGPTNNFAIDPNFRVGYVQNWQASIQRDLPASLVMIVTYLGIKGTRAPQEFYPNTYPLGVSNPCASCASGYIYEASNGNSTREAAQIQLRRRLHNGFTAQLQYTYAKAIDDSALGGRGQATTLVAQNWLDLSAERGLSSFDQRHLLNFTTQYTTGQGIGGWNLLSGWRGTLFKEWTVTTTTTAGSGFPLSPEYLTAVPGTGFTGIRPDYTGAPLYNAPPGLALNPLAYTAPIGHWGNAGRNTITGPMQFTFNAAFARTFRLKDRYSLDVRIDATNPINHVTYTAWNTIINSPQFGTAVSANPMRSLQTTVRLRF